MSKYTSNATTVVSRLSAIGIEIPKPAQAQLNQNRLAVNLPTTAEAKALVANAKDQAQLDAAVLAFAQAYTVADVDGMIVGNQIRSIRSRALREVLDPVIPELYDAVAAKYREAASPFMEALSRVPDLTGYGAADVPFEAASAINDARAAVAPLNAILAAYNALLQLEHSDTGYYQIDDGRKTASANRIVARLGAFDSVADQTAAIHLVQRYAVKDSSVYLGSMAPHSAIVRAGGRLEMVAPVFAGPRELEVV